MAWAVLAAADGVLRWLSVAALLGLRGGPSERALDLLAKRCDRAHSLVEECLQRPVLDSAGKAGLSVPEALELCRSRAGLGFGGALAVFALGVLFGLLAAGVACLAWGTRRSPGVAAALAEAPPADAPPAAAPRERAIAAVVDVPAESGAASPPVEAGGGRKFVSPRQLRQR